MCIWMALTPHLWCTFSVYFCRSDIVVSGLILTTLSRIGLLPLRSFGLPFLPMTVNWSWSSDASSFNPQHWLTSTSHGKTERPRPDIIVQNSIIFCLPLLICTYIAVFKDFSRNFTSTFLLLSFYFTSTFLLPFLYQSSTHRKKAWCCP